jgi:hypothetical protein
MKNYRYRVALTSIILIIGVSLISSVSATTITQTEITGFNTFQYNAGGSGINRSTANQVSASSSLFGVVDVVYATIYLADEAVGQSVDLVVGFANTPGKPFAYGNKTDVFANSYAYTSTSTSMRMVTIPLYSVTGTNNFNSWNNLGSPTVLTSGSGDIDLSTYPSWYLSFDNVNGSYPVDIYGTNATNGLSTTTCYNQYDGYVACNYFGQPYYSLNYFYNPQAVGLAYPSNGATIPDFQNWVATTTNLFEGTLSVKYGFSSSFLDHTDSINLANPAYLVSEVNSFPLYIPKTNSLLGYAPAINPTTWFAQLVNTITTASGTTEITSPIISFNVDYTATSTYSGAGSYNPFSFFTTDFPTSTIPVVSCGDTDYICKLENWFVTNLQTIFAATFEPSPASMQQFGNLGIIKDKIPFGYLPLLAGAFNNLTASGTPIATTTDLSGLSDMISPVDYALSVLMFLMIGLWILHKTSIMEL